MKEIEEEKEKIYSLENIDFTNHSIKLNSPRSLEACKRKGVDPQELYYLHFHEFKNANPQVRTLEPDIQKIRWNHFNKIRESTIERLIDERRNLIKERLLYGDYNEIFSDQVSKTKITNSIHKNKNSSYQLSQFKSTAIENDLKLLEKIKNKQKLEVQNLIENELRNEFIRKENEEKMEEQKKREEEHKRWLSLAQKEKERERKKLEEQKKMQMKKEYEEQKRYNQDKYLEEQRKIQEEAFFEQQKLKERKRLEEEQKKKQEEFRVMTEKIILDQQRRAEERKRELDEKERERQEFLMYQRSAKRKENERVKEKHEKKIEMTKMKMEEKVKGQMEDYVQKEKMAQEKRGQYEEMKNESLKRKHEEAQKKQEAIQKVFEKNQEQEQMKQYEYNRKQEEIERQKKLQEKMKQAQLSREKEEQKRKEAKYAETQERNSCIATQKANFILQRINLNNEKTEMLKEVKEKELMYRNEKETLKRAEKELNIRRVEKMKEYEKEQVMEKIKEKSQKIEEFKKEKSQILTKKKELASEVSKKKDDVMKKFELIMKKNMNITPEIVKELFPDDDKLYEKIMAMKAEFENKSNIRRANTEKSQSAILNRSSEKNKIETSEKKNQIKPRIPTARATSKDNLQIQPQETTNKNKIEDSKTIAKNFKKPGLSEQDICRMIEEFKKKMMSDLLKVLSEEKFKEEERELMYNRVANLAEKKRLEKIFSMERAQSSDRIMKFNE